MGKNPGAMECIPIKPLSVNRAWQGRRFKTKEYDQYIHDCLLLMEQHDTLTGSLLVKLKFLLKYPKKCDLDNMIKPLLDIMVKKGWIEDDRLICELYATKEQSEKEGVCIGVEQI